MLPSFAACRAGCLGALKYAAGSREEQMAVRALTIAVQTVQPHALCDNGPRGWIPARRERHLQKKEQRRVAKEVKRKMAQAYGLPPLAILFAPLLWTVISAVVSKVLDWLWNRWSKDSSFGTCVINFQREFESCRS